MHLASCSLSNRRRFSRSQILLLAAALHLVFWTGLAPAQSHFQGCASHTGNNATIIFPDTSSILVGDHPIQKGDEIAVFDAAGHCAGAAQWTGKNIALTVWGTNEITPDKDGFVSGEKMHFRIWDASTGKEWQGLDHFKVTFAAHHSYLATNNTYAPDRIYVVDTLHFEAAKQAFR